MTFIATLIALIIERFFHWSHLRHWNWFKRYQHFLSVRFSGSSPYFLLIVAVLPPIIGVQLVNYLLTGWLDDLPRALFGIVVLLYCFGPINLWVQIYGCIRALNKEDPVAAIEEVKNSFGIIATDQPQTFHQSFTRAIFIAANQRIYAVIFWFAALGPAGAVLYRAVNLCAMNPSLGVGSTAKQVEAWLDWVPVRLFTFIFALGGHFTRVFTHWRLYLKESASANDTMLGECGLAALAIADTRNIPEDGSAENEALILLDRVFVMSLVVLALLVLIAR